MCEATTCSTSRRRSASPAGTGSAAAASSPAWRRPRSRCRCSPWSSMRSRARCRWTAQVLHLPARGRPAGGRRRSDRRDRLGDRGGAADQLLLRRSRPHADVADGDQAVALVVFVAVAPSSAARSSSRYGGPVRPSAPSARPRRCRRWPVPASTARSRCGEFSAGARDVRNGVGDAEGPGSWGWRLGRRRACRLGAARAARRSCASTFRPARTCGWSAAARRCSPRIAGCWRRSQAPLAPPTRAAAERQGGGGRNPGRRSTVSAPHCSPRSGTTCAPRWPGSRRRSAACARTTSSGRSRSARSCWRRSRTRPDRLDGRGRATCSTPAGSRPARCHGAADAGRPGRGRLRGAARRAEAAGRVAVERARGPAAGARRSRPAATGARQRDRERARHGAGEEPVEVAPAPAPSSAKIEIVDHGRGSRRPTAERIFEPFQRLDDRGGGSDSGSRSRAASSRRWAERWSPTRRRAAG